MKRYLVCLLLFLIFPALAHAVDFVPREIYKKASGAVVFISAFNEGKAIGSAGTGSIISSDGMVLTNSHVITDPEKNKPYNSIVVCLKPKQLTGDTSRDLSERYNAEVVTRNPDLDLAVVKIKDLRRDVSVILIGDASNVSTGDQVAAIGHPEGGGLWILTTGTISGMKLLGDKDTFQTEASTNRGNSGGPLLNAGSALIGINTCMVRKADDGLAIVGVNFAVKSTQVKGWLQKNGIKVALAPLPASEQTEPPKVQQEQPKAKSAPTEVKPADPPTKPAPQKPKTPKAAPGTGDQKKALQKRTEEAAGSNQKEPTLDDDFKEFRGAGGQVMYGVPDGNFNLDRATLLLFEKAKRDAEKSFDELDELENKIRSGKVD